MDKKSAARDGMAEEGEMVAEEALGEAYANPSAHISFGGSPNETGESPVPPAAGGEGEIVSASEPNHHSTTVQNGKEDSVLSPHYPCYYAQKFAQLAQILNAEGYFSAPLCSFLRALR